MSAVTAESAVVDRLRRADGGMTMDQLVASTDHKRQEVRRAVTDLLKANDKIYTVGVEDGVRVFDVR